MKAITEQTLIPLSLAIVLVATGSYIVQLREGQAQFKNEIADLKAQQLRYNETVEKIDRRLARIEGKLDAKAQE